MSQSVHRAFQSMVKPIGPLCNLNCTYCYYLEKATLYPDKQSCRMSDAVLETYIRDYIASQSTLDNPEIWFLWQGGEPTLLGVDFFRRVVSLQERYADAAMGKTVRHAIQTNGTLLDPAWAAFFKDHDFLVGVSIDGPRELHDRYRVDRGGRPTFDAVMTGIEVLKDHDVTFNALSVVHRQNAREPRAVYDFLKSIGVDYMQFIPIVERTADGKNLAGAPGANEEDAHCKVTPWSVLPKDYGSFLNGVFDTWIKEDVGRIYVQFFDIQLGLWLGAPAGLCYFAPTCGQGLAVEHNGDLYACDHYVYPEFKLGNIMKTPLSDLATSPEQIRFGDAKRDTLPRQCTECTWLFACNGGCPKHRILKAKGDGVALNYFCRSYLDFYAHAGERLSTMARLISMGRPAADIMRMPSSNPAQPQAKPRRNDPCPCGSGKKYKNCCGSAKS